MFSDGNVLPKSIYELYLLSHFICNNSTKILVRVEILVDVANEISMQADEVHILTEISMRWEPWENALIFF